MEEQKPNIEKKISSKNDNLLAELSKKRILLKDREFIFEGNNLITCCDNCNETLYIPYLALQMINNGDNEELLQETAKRKSWKEFFISGFGRLYCDGRCYHLRLEN